MEEPRSALEEMDGEGKSPVPGADGTTQAELEVDAGCANPVPNDDLYAITDLAGGESDDDRPIRSLLKAKRRRFSKKDREVEMALAEEGITRDMDDTLASLRKKLRTPLEKKRSTQNTSTTSIEDTETPSDGLDVSLSSFFSKARKLSFKKSSLKGRKQVEEAPDAGGKHEISEVTDVLDKKSGEISAECCSINITDEHRVFNGVTLGENSDEKYTSALSNRRSISATVNPVEETRRSDNLKQCSQGKLRDPLSRKVKESKAHASRKGKIESLESIAPLPPMILVKESSVDVNATGKFISSDDEASPDDNRSRGHTSNIRDHCTSGMISEMDDQYSDKPKVLPRVPRKIKRNKDGDMTYEGDIEWEALMNDDQGPFGNFKEVDEERTSRERNRFKSVLSVDSSDADLAAVAAGLKAHAAGPVEKIKFKDLFKRKGGLRDYLECRNNILYLWSKNMNRILSLKECGVTDTVSKDESPGDSLIREIYTFLDRSGYINGGVATIKDEQSLFPLSYEPSVEDVVMETAEERVDDSKNAIPFAAADDVSVKERTLSDLPAQNLEARSTEIVVLCTEAASCSEIQPDLPAQNSEAKSKEILVPCTEAESCSGIQPEEHSTVHMKIDEAFNCPDSPMHQSLEGIGVKIISSSQDEQSIKQCVSVNGEAKIHAVKSTDAVKTEDREELTGSGSIADDLSAKSIDNEDIFSKENLNSFKKEITCAESSLSSEIKGIDLPMQWLDVKTMPESDLKESPRSIIIIGAGPAGLTAARHLKRQGFSVTVLEARDRIGGRVYTDRSSLSVPVDLGASIITGIEPDLAAERRADPSSLICAQLGLELTVLNSDCPLYDVVTGGKVPSDLDEALEVEYNSLLDDMVDLVNHDEEGSESMSLEEGLEYALRKRHLMDRHATDDDAMDAGDVLNPLERRVMNWHFANLEYGCAAVLKEVSLPHWNQDDIYGGFGGAHCMIKGGYSSVVETLGEGVSIHLKQVVTEIKYEAGNSSPHVRNLVKVMTSDGGVFVGDAALITVPLGCLKVNAIKFSPALPDWKQASIHRLGFGVLNKVVMEFPEVFWDDSVDYFGATSEETTQRGRCFMFWNVKKTVGAPVLIALVVGKAAIDGQNRSASDHVNHALTVLRRIFGVKAVPEPVGAVVTNWGMDPFSRGAYSYVAVGSSGEDYDVLARPIGKCLFFAGEATSKEHPDTVGGAMLSGLREAVRIIDIFHSDHDYTAEVEEMEMAERQEESERDEVRELQRKLDSCRVSNSMLMNNDALLKDLFFNAKTIPGRLHLVKELLHLPVDKLKFFAGTREALSVLNTWILDSMGKDATQLLRHCIRLLVLVSTDLLAVRFSGIGRTVKEKVCVHTSRDIRSIASQLVSVWVEVFRERKVKSLTQPGPTDASKLRSRDPSSLRQSQFLSIEVPPEGIDLKEEKKSKTLAAAEAARAAKAARLAAEAYTSSEADSTITPGLPKILSFHKFVRREHIDGGGILGAECISEMDSRNCRVQNWSVDFSAACPDLDDSRLPVGEAVDLGLTRAWVDSDTLGSGVKDYLAIERWQSQAMAADPQFYANCMKNEVSNKVSEGSVKENSNSNPILPRKSNSSVEGRQRGVNHIKCGVVDYVGSLLMPLYKARKMDKEGYKSIMKKAATKVVEQCTESEKMMTAHEFLDPKRKNKIRAFVDKLIERHLSSSNQSSKS